jgi:hypothetical protein
VLGYIWLPDGDYMKIQPLFVSGDITPAMLGSVD